MSKNSVIYVYLLIAQWPLVCGGQHYTYIIHITKIIIECNAKHSNTMRKRIHYLTFIATISIKLLTQVYLEYFVK